MSAHPLWFELGVSVRCVFDKETGELRAATPKEIDEEDEAPKGPVMVITNVNHETGTITVKAVPQ